MNTHREKKKKKKTERSFAVSAPRTSAVGEKGERTAGTIAETQYRGVVWQVPRSNNSNNKETK